MVLLGLCIQITWGALLNLLSPALLHLDQLNQNLLVERYNTAFEKALSGNLDMYLSLKTPAGWEDHLFWN